MLGSNIRKDGKRIGSLPADESDAMLGQLFDYCERDALVYEHVWTPGDFVMWDNRCVVRGRTDFPHSERRLLQRTVFQGEKPAMAGLHAV